MTFVMPYSFSTLPKSRLAYGLSGTLWKTYPACLLGCLLNQAVTQGVSIPQSGSSQNGKKLALLSLMESSGDMFDGQPMAKSGSSHRMQRSCSAA